MARGRRTRRRPKGEGKAGERSAKRSHLREWVIGSVAVVVLAVIVAVLVAFPSRPGSGSGREVDLDIPGGESPEALAARLSAAGLTDSPRLFGFYLHLTGGASRVVSGDHLLADDLSPGDIMARLERSTSAGHVKVTFPEGWTMFDMAKKLHASRVCSVRRFLDAAADRALLDELHITGESAEGFLFPATYELAPDSDPKDVVRRLKSEFDKRYDAIDGRHAAGANDLGSSLGWGQREIVTLASMIEKEAAVDDERAIIASVFLNRLRDPAFYAGSGKYLQCDPTAGYGCLVHPESASSCTGYTGKITHDIVADPQNPYNTYKHEGLPPGPISNPGAKSLEAVLAPATTHYFYFVARGEGRHTFSETYTSHATAVHGGAKGGNGAHP